MPPVRSLKRIPIHVWIPPQDSANFKVTVERQDGTIDNITDFLLNCTIKDGVTEGIGNFEFEIPNPNETYTDAWTGMEIFRYYCNYAGGEPTTLRFRGRVEKPSKRNNNVLVTGRSEALFVHGQTIYKSYENRDAGYIIKDLFDTYGEGRFDTSGINVDTGIILTLTFAELSFWDGIEAVCEASNYDCYVSCNLTVEFLNFGSRINTAEGIVHEYNLIEVGDFAADLKYVINQIKFVGGTIGGVQVRYTANDVESQTANGLRSEPVKDDGIVTIAAAKALAEYLLEQKKNPPLVGDVTGLLLATIQPGESIRLSSPLEGIQPNAYRIISYEHKIGSEGLTTMVRINKEPRKMSNIMKDRIQREHRTGGASSNPENLDFAEIELFDAIIGTSNNTEILEGVLRLTTGESSGWWQSPYYASNDDNNVLEKIRIELVGDNLPGVIIEVSYDNGYTFHPVGRGEVLNAGAGYRFVVKLTLTTGSQVDSLNAQYSLK